MKTTIVAALSLLVHGTSVTAHHAFSRLILDGTVTEDWEYVRDVAAADTSSIFHPEYSKTTPQFGDPDLATTNITCGRNAFEAAGTTKTATVAAGSELGFEIHIEGSAHYLPIPYIQHRGPAFIWLARAPDDDLENFSGVDGDWFKIDYLGPVNDSSWETHRQTQVFFSIPEAVPPGKYLLRIEHVWVMPHVLATGYNQWYVNCAHVEITGNGNGVPPAGSRFPGTYDLSTPGLWVTNEQAGYDDATGLLDYVPPEPPVWSG